MLQWQLSLASTQWWSSPETCIGQLVLSPKFMVCGYLWYVACHCWCLNFAVAKPGELTRVPHLGSYPYTLEDEKTLQERLHCF